MSLAEETGRPNQKRRTRKDLLQAAARLLRRGKRPSLEEVAEEALVSRATAYRYFPNIEALLIEAALDVASPEAEKLFDGAPDDPATRVERLDEAFDEMIRENETPLRMMLAHSLQASVDPGQPARQNRRSPLIEAALEPARSEFSPEKFDLLKQALALVIGTESMLVFKDVLQIRDEEARAVKRWVIRSLIDSAREDAQAD